MIKKLLSFIAILLISGSLYAAGPGLFRPSDIPSGLQGYWNLSEANGTRADSSGNGNTLTDNNTVESNSNDYWNTGESSADFELGFTEYLSITDASQTGLDIVGSYTFSAWIKVESAATQYLLGKWSSNSGYAIGVFSSGELFILQETLNSFSVIGAINAGKWYHVAFVYDTTANTISFYRDGNLNKTNVFTTDPTNNATAFSLGQRGDNAGYYDGLIKDAAIWNVVLTPLQIKSLALGVDMSTEAYRPGDISTAPNAWWKLNEISDGSATSRTDSAGSHTLTDVNTVTTSGGYIEGAGARFTSANSEHLIAGDSVDWDFGTDDFSITSWIKHASTGAQIIIDRGNEADFWLESGDTAGGQLNARVAGTFKSVAWTARTSGVWYHIAFVRTSGSVQLYVDGVTLGSSSSMANSVSSTNQVVVGGRTGVGHFNGNLEDVAIWNGYALTATEVKDLASAFPVQQSGITAYWKLDEASGGAVDSIGVNDLTENGTGGVGSVSGQVGDARDFEVDDSDYFSITDAAQDGLSFSNQLSMGGWLKVESFTGNDEIYSKRASIGSQQEYTFYNTNSTPTLVLDSDGSFPFTLTLNAGSTVSAGTFYHIMYWYDGVNAKMYLNSVEIGSAGFTGPIFTGTAGFLMAAGRDSGLVLQNYDGVIDESFASQRHFKEEERKSIYIKGLNAEEITSDPSPTIVATRSRVIVVT